MLMDDGAREGVEDHANLSAGEQRSGERQQKVAEAAELTDNDAVAPQPARIADPVDSSVVDGNGIDAMFGLDPAGFPKVRGDVEHGIGRAEGREHEPCFVQKGC